MAVSRPHVLPRYDNGGRTGARPSGATPRRRLSGRATARSRTQPLAAVIALVLVVLVIGIIYVAQTIRLAATTYEIEGLMAERDDLARQVQTVETSVLRWGAESTVLDRAQRLGLGQVETRVRLPAR